MNDQNNSTERGGAATSPSNVTLVRRPADRGPTGDTVERASLSWRAIFAGFFLSLITYMIFSALGLAIGASQLQEVVTGESGLGGIGVGSALWVILSAVISLFVGAYYAARVAGLIPTRVGRIQGAVIAAVFFAFLFWQAGALIGTIGSGVGSVAGTMGNTAEALVNSPQVQSTVEQALEGMDLQSPPDEVAQGVAVRLLQGDPQGAQDYLVQETGITEAQANRVVEDVQANIGQVAGQIGTTAAQIASTFGWTLFGSLLLGLISAAVGGGVGARYNLSHPLSRGDEDALRRGRAA